MSTSPQNETDVNRQGALAALTAPELGAIAIDGALKQSAIRPELIQEAFVGNVLSANLGQVSMNGRF